ncbi:hypothetical protein AVEN_190788-1, partial [Araneus ventricosus]
PVTEPFPFETELQSGTDTSLFSSCNGFASSEEVFADDVQMASVLTAIRRMGERGRKGFIDKASI